MVPGRGEVGEKVCTVPNKELVVRGCVSGSSVPGPGHRPQSGSLLLPKSWQLPIAWAFALGVWWYASHSTVLGSAQFCLADLAGWWMPGGCSCWLAQMQRGPVRMGRWALLL